MSQEDVGRDEAQGVPRVIVPELPASSPCLFFQPDTIAELRRKRDNYVWARQGYSAARQLADRVWEPTPAGGNDGWVMPAMPPPVMRNRHFLAAAQAAALVGHVDDDETYLRRAWELLCRGLREFKSAWWQPASLRLTFAADGVRPVLTAAEQVELDDLLRQALASAPHAQAKANIGAGHRKAMVGLGILLRDRALIDEALNDPERGTMVLMRLGIRDDGLWCESAPSYHHYAMLQFAETAWLCRLIGIDLDGLVDGRLRLGCRAGFGLLDSGLRYPNTGDTWKTRLGAWVNATDVLSGPALLFELAVGLFGDPWCGWALRRTSRHCMDNFAYGVAELPEEEPPAASRLYQDSGVAALRAGARDQFWQSDGLTAYLRFGPHGGWHGHQDALALELRAHDCDMVTDRGRAARYADHVHYLWHRSTLSHSTVVVDRQNQASDCQNACLSFVAADVCSAVCVESSGAYAGVTCRRSLVLTDRYLIDHYVLHATAAHTYHYVLQGDGTFMVDGETAPLATLGLGDGYSFLCNLRCQETAGPCQADLRQGSWDSHRWSPAATGMRVHSLGEATSRLVLATVPASGSEGTGEALLLEAEGTDVEFLTVLEPFRDEPEIRGISRIAAAEGLCLQIQLAAGSDIVCYAPGATAEFAVDDIQFTGEFMHLRRDADGNESAVRRPE